MSLGRRTWVALGLGVAVLVGSLLARDAWDARWLGWVALGASAATLLVVAAMEQGWYDALAILAVIAVVCLAVALLG